ncbi:hypothetical protein [Alkalihalobacillus sp. TS-13]|uniref:hypothetical protein n=1 Tax=Alkalihalobacillus sp. TS-13 TaxID=2842455 RepID=UPI001C87368D|nr:hypothetical protein [Alkalihalobacillus sp. TS-13]
MQWNKMWLQVSYDLKNIKRDLVLLMSMFAPLILAALLKFGFPPLERLVVTNFQVSLASYFPLMVVTCLLVTPFTVGMLSGFLILDERDEQILSYLSITPVSKSHFILYRLLFPVVICILTAGFLLYVNAWVISLWKLAALLILSLEAPIIALMMAVFADNKVEGLALGKVISISVTAPIVGFFIHSGWKWIGLVFPPFWIAEVFFANSTSMKATLLCGALLYHAFIILWLIRKLEKRIG